MRSPASGSSGSVSLGTVTLAPHLAGVMAAEGSEGREGNETVPSVVPALHLPGVMAAESCEGREGSEGVPGIVPGWKALFLAGTKADTEWVTSSMRETGQTPQMRGPGLPFRYTAADAVAASTRRGGKPTSLLCLNIQNHALLTMFLDGFASRHERLEAGIDLWDAKYDPKVMRFEIQNVAVLQDKKCTRGGESSEGGEGGDGRNPGGEVALESEAKRARR